MSSNQKETKSSLNPPLSCSSTSSSSPLSPSTSTSSTTFPSRSTEILSTSSSSTLFLNVTNFFSKYPQIFLSTLQSQLSDTQKNLLCGGIAGCVGKTIIAPLNRVTILLQVSDSSGTNMSAIHTARGIWKEEGIKAFWKGNLTSIIHRFPYSAINFSAYEIFRDSFCGEDKDEHHVSPKETPVVRLICGGLAGALACTACYPIELVKTRLTVDKKNHYSGIINTFTSVVKKEGFFSLYKGLSTALVVVVPTLALSYSSYGTLKSYILHHQTPVLYNQSSDQLTVVGGLVCGSTSGIVGTLFSYPVDLVRHRLQVKGFHALHEASSSDISSGQSLSRTQKSTVGAMAEFRQIYRTNGIKGLYRGLTPELLKVVPMVGITFCTFELCSEFLHTSSRL